MKRDIRAGLSPANIIMLLESDLRKMASSQRIESNGTLTSTSSGCLAFAVCMRSQKDDHTAVVRSDSISRHI